MLILFHTMLFIGGAFMLVALIPLRIMLANTKTPRLRRKWKVFMGFTIFFLIGYCGVAALFDHAALSIGDLLIAGVMMVGGFYVLCVAHLSSATTADIGRVAELERIAYLDPLTGVFNRRYFDVRLPEEAGRAREAAYPLSLLLVDLDHFKKVNDRHGHQVGDAALRFASASILRTIRDEGFVVRYGGEEFAVIAPHRDILAAAVLAEMILRDVSGSPMNLATAEQIWLTASIGAAQLEADESVCELVKRADEALYRAKRGGRNRVCYGVTTPPAMTA
jgi:diguanylate cyclase (GGDEF)-like protein